MDARPRRGHDTTARHLLPWVRCAAALLMIGLNVTPTVAAAVSEEVFVFDMVVGRLDITEHDIFLSNGQAAGNIVGGFTELDAGGNAIPAAAKQKLIDWFPHGLTYMQAATFNFKSGSQQQIKRDMNGGDLVGTFSDPPQGGYTERDGTKTVVNDDTPWYSILEPADNLNPALNAGAPPPTATWDRDGDPLTGLNGKEFSAQFFDGPRLSFGSANGIDGLAGLLGGQDGTLQFETALVGVKDMPSIGQNPNALQTGLLDGPYKVVVLKTFVWGMNFRFVGNAADGLTASDYDLTALFGPTPVLGDGVTQSFKDAFDGQGSNSAVEWNVQFVNHAVPEPAAILGWLMLTGAALTRRQLRHCHRP